MFTGIDEHFSFMVDGFEPPYPDGESHMGRWGFHIALKSDMVKKLVKTQLPEEGYKNLEKRALGIIEVGWGNQPLFMMGHRPLSFHDGSALLAHITVPGNACGLDPSYDSSIENCLKCGEPLVWSPHNVDFMPQSYCLLSIWLYWFNHVVYLVRGEGG
jgi:hypothetical protein